MAQVRPLRYPPIIEAVIDFRVQYSRRTAAADFEQFHQLISADYPGSKTRQGVEVKIDLDGGKTEQLSILSGFLFSSADGTQVVQSKVDGFSFSRLKPYQDWDTMFREAWRLWVAYRNRFCPDRIIRLSTRFINRLDIPGTNIDFDDYLLVGPRIPEGAPQQLSSFSTSVEIPSIGENTVGRVRYVFESATITDVAPLLLDIDVIRECDIAPDADEYVQATIAKLRPIKNILFFGSLTEKAARIFE